MQQRRHNCKNIQKNQNHTTKYLIINIILIGRCYISVRIMLENIIHKYFQTLSLTNLSINIKY